MPSPPFPPRATYRVQLHSGYTFEHLTGQVTRLQALGVSHCYCSPVFQPVPGSRHGYDVCSYREINEELGGEGGLRRLARTLHEHDMGLVLDFVPNHMGIASSRNEWWQNVLEYGPASSWAEFFDLRWDSIVQGSQPQVLLPVLPEHYGRLLEKGELRVVLERESLVLAYGEARFPLRPASSGELLRSCASPDLAELGEQFVKVEAESRDNRLGSIAALKDRLARLLESDSRHRRALEARLSRLNGTPGHHSHFDELDRLIGAQHYRLARWQAGAHAVNYRRFFAINTLVGLRIEEPSVFAEVHAKLRQLLEEGVVDGVRIDHIDGLRDPQGYLNQLALLMANAASDEEAPYLVVEKILGHGERLPEEWPVDGTTGYEFIADLAGLLTDRKGQEAFDGIYTEFTGHSRSFAEEARLNKKMIMREQFSSAVLALAGALHRLVQVDRRWRDFTITELAGAIEAIVANFRVYRAYRRMGDSVRREDRSEVERARLAAREREARIDPESIDFVAAVLTGDYPEEGAIADVRAGLVDWSMTFQQYTGAVMAKAVEDTTFYTYNRFVALNEVGGFPETFGASVEAFHEANRVRATLAPHGLLATSTHDTKMSEDVRARLYALSEIPEEWRTWVNEWHALNAVHTTEIDGRVAPDAEEEYRLYQSLLGAWPSGEADRDESFRQRMREYLRKAVNEAKVNTTESNPRPDWLEACDHFVDAILCREKSPEFLTSLRSAVVRLTRPGRIKALAQVILKLTSPGVPDIYQGNEAWDFSLVDPDNRREVDFEGLENLARATQDRSLKELWDDASTGGVKLAITRALLRFRAEHPALFSQGNYEPLTVEGPRAGHVVAFARRYETECLLTIVGVRVANLQDTVWAGMKVKIDGQAIVWRSLLCDGLERRAGCEIPLQELFAELPFAVLYSNRGDGPR